MELNLNKFAKYNLQNNIIRKIEKAKKDEEVKSVQEEAKSDVQAEVKNSIASDVDLWKQLDLLSARGTSIVKKNNESASDTDTCRACNSFEDEEDITDSRTKSIAESAVSTDSTSSAVDTDSTNSAVSTDSTTSAVETDKTASAQGTDRAVEDDSINPIDNGKSTPVEDELNPVVEDSFSKTGYDLYVFEEKIKNADFEDINPPIDVYYANLIKADLKERYNYSDDYLDTLLNYCRTKACFEIYATNSENAGLQSYLLKFGEYYKELLLPPELHTYVNNTNVLSGETDVVDLYHTENSLSPSTVYGIISNTNGDSNLQAQFLNHMCKSALNNTSIEEQNAIFGLLAENINIPLDDGYRLFNSDISEDFAKLNTNGDGSWFDDLYTQLTQIRSTLIHMEQSEIDNATTINSDILFKDTDSISSYYITSHLNELLLSDDPGIRKLAKILSMDTDSIYLQFINNNAKDIDISSFCYEDYVTATIYVLNTELGIKNTNLKLITPELISKLADENTNIFDKISEVVTDKKLLDALIITGIDGYINEVNQGDTGDCYLLSAIRSLVAEPQGRNLVKNSIQWSSDKSCVYVYFRAWDRYAKVTLYDIETALDKKKGHDYSSGDLDVLVMELAFQQLGCGGSYKELKSGQACDFWNGFVGGGDWEIGMGLDDIANTVWGWITGEGGRVDMDSDDIIDYLKGIYSAKQSGANVAATCAVYSSDNDSYYCTDINGEKHKFYDVEGEGSAFGNKGTGHVFAIIEITDTTVTFANPWDSKNERYTVTWGEFANIGFSGMESVVIGYDYKITGTNEFCINSQVFNIKDILENRYSGDIHLVNHHTMAYGYEVDEYWNMIDDAETRMDVLCSSIKEHFAGCYDSDKIDEVIAILKEQFHCAWDEATNDQYIDAYAFNQTCNWLDASLHYGWNDKLNKNIYNLDIRLDPEVFIAEFIKLLNDGEIVVPPDNWESK